MKTLIRKYNSINLSYRIITGSFIGIIIGLVFKEQATGIEFLGDIFLRLVKMCVPLLIFCSIVESTASLPLKELGKVGGKTLYWFVVTTALAAVFTGLAVYIFPPSVSSDLAQGAVYEGFVPTGSFLDTLVAFIPENALKALSEGIIAQIIVFGAFFGIATNMLREEVTAVETLYQVILGTRRAIMKVVTMIMGYAPIGIAAMLAAVVGSQGVGIISSMGQVLLMVTVIDVLFFVGYTIFISLRFRLNLVQLMKNSANIMLVAVTTGSSAITLPVSLVDVPNKIGVKERISNFVLPLGNAINTNGAPISNIVSAVACASMYGIAVDNRMLVMISVYAFISAFGNPGVPGGGIVSLAVVFGMAGLPLEGVAVFAGLDYFYSLTRVIVNVMGNIYSAIYVGNKMGEFDREVFNKKVVKSTENVTA